MTENERIFYSCACDEPDFLHDNEFDAILSHLEEQNCICDSKIIVRRYKPVEPKIKAGYLLDCALDWINDEYTVCGDEISPTGAMLQAEKVFINAVLKECVIKACEYQDSYFVDIQEWCVKNQCYEILNKLWNR